MIPKDIKNKTSKTVNTTQRHIILLLMLVLIIVSAGEYAYQKFEYSRVLELINSEKADHRTLLQKIISFKSSSLIAYTNDYTYWDEMVSFTKTDDTVWAKGNIDVSLATYGADFVWVFDSSETLKYFTFIPGVIEIDPNAVNVKMLMSGSSDKRSNHFYTDISGNIIELSVFSIHHTNDPKRQENPNGYFAAGRLWCTDYMNGITELTGSRLRISGDSALPGYLEENEFIVTNVFDLAGSDGTLTGRLITETDLSDLKTAYYKFKQQLMVMNIIIALILLTSAFTLYYIVNRPLKIINMSLSTGESKYILPLLNRQNEFGYMAKLIYDFFEQKQALLNEIQDRIDAEYNMKISEEKLKGTIAEKEVLIKEVHHRVKNNLQIIISLIRLQASKVSDENLNSHLNETLNRIKSIALVHEMLYRSDDLSRIEFREYIDKITNSLRTIYSDKTRGININVCSDKVLFTVDKAVPCAIIINELVTNSIKHAFKKTKSGDITINMNRQKGFYTMKISDNGSGIGKDFNFEENDSLGMNLVSSLADQLDAKVSIENGIGTTFNFRFPVN